MQSAEGYGALPMDLHVPPQGYHPYFRKGAGEETAAAVQTRILEMRKEKSRDAARSRRGKENYEFYELAKLLPLPAAITSQLDKASIIRLTISYLKLRDFSSHGDPPWNRDGPPPNKTVKGGPLRPRSMTTIAMDIFEQHQGTHILQSLDGFAFALAADGRFLYISETVSIYLGLSQVEMTGSSIFDYTHQQDHAELAEQLGINLSQAQPLSSPGSVGSDEGSSSTAPSTPTGLERPAPVMNLNSNSPYKGLERSFCIRMKSTLTKRGCHFKSSGYRVVLVLSHLRPQYTFSHSRKQPPTVMGLVALAIALPPPSVNEVRLESDMFVTRLTFEFRVAHCEPRVSELLDYTAEELTGKNMYTLCHGQDVQKLRKCHIDLIHKGQVMSGYYRLINKNGGFTWLQTCATVICNTKNSEEQSIICVNYVLSRIEYENCIMDCSQLRHINNLKPDDPNNSERGSSPDKEGKDDTSSRDGEPNTSPKSSEGHSSAGGDSSHSDQLTHLGLGSKHCAENHRHPVENCNAPDDSCSSYEVEQKSLDLGDDCRLEDKTSVPCVDVTMDQRTSVDRQRKRKLTSGDSTPVDVGTKSPKSRPASSSSLHTSSLDNAAFIGTTNTANPVSPERPVLPSSDECSSPQSQCDRSHGAQAESADEQEGIARPWKRSPNTCSTSFPQSNGPSSLSVKELEDAMNKHLPSSSSVPSHGSPAQELVASKTHHQQQHQSQRSTIQWIGGSQTTTLPATTLLRQLYANRESVIRSGSHVSRPAYYGEVQGTLPTPPGSGSETYHDQTQFVLPAKMAVESYGVIPGYPPAPVTVGSYMDTYGTMTPPASVSPREKFHPGISDSPAFSEAAAAAAAAAIPHMRHYVSDPSLQHLPLKPQVFVHPSTIDPSAYSHSHTQHSLGSEQQQLYAHHASSFHLYHPTSSNKSPHHPPNGTTWYTQPNS